MAQHLIFSDRQPDPRHPLRRQPPGHPAAGRLPRPVGPAGLGRGLPGGRGGAVEGGGGAARDDQDGRDQGGGPR